ncbi:MAG: hypothetical protein IT350_04905 [Deltaproteobacteria bacterium]|nr:hypothetical protein [Deltaproteobacteria bacterium]
MTGDGKRRLTRLSLTLLLWVVPVLPCYLGLVAIKYPYARVLCGALAVACVFFAASCFSTRDGWKVVLPFVVMIVLAWGPVIAIASWLRRFFPGVEIVFPVVAVSLLISGRLIRSGAGWMIDGAICLAAFLVSHGCFHEFSWSLMSVVALLLATALGLHRILENARSSPAPRWAHLSIIAGLGVIGTLSIHSYSASHPEAAAEIASQPGVRQLASFDRQDINFFIDDGAGNGWRFYHHIADFCAYRAGRSDACRSETYRPSDEAVWDAGRRAYWFFSGPKLWLMRTADAQPEFVASFEPEFRRMNPTFAGGNIRGFPAGNPTKFLAQFDEASGVVYFDLEQRSAKAIEVGNRNTDCIWSPDGNSIVFLGSNKASLRPLRGKLTKTDLDGRVLRERYIDDVVSYITQTDRSYFYISYYSRHRVEKVSYDSLETIDSVETDRYPRSAYHDSARDLLIVPSFLDGTLAFHRSERLEFLARIRIGTRVRAVTRSLNDGEILIASSAGQFAVDVDEVLRQSAQPDRPGAVEAGEPL